MRRLLLATSLAALLPFAAHAIPVVQFSQVGDANTVLATDDGTSTTISATNSLQNVSQDIGGYLGLAFLNLIANSVDAAVGFGTAVAQHFSGSFSLTTGPSGGGTNILSGSFTDAALGAGPALGLTIGAPPDDLSVTSDIIPIADLALPAALDFALTNVTPSIHIDGTTLAAFQSTIGGNASASEVNTPEPASLAILGVGLIGLGMVRYRRGSGGLPV